MSGNWKKRIGQFEQAPPQGVWENIARMLDDDNTASLKQRLQQYEATPPPLIWQNIAVALDDTTHTAKIIPLPVVQKKRYWPYAAAAVLLALVVAGIFFVTPPGKIQNNATAVNVPVTKKNAPAATPDNPASSISSSANTNTPGTATLNKGSTKNIQQPAASNTVNAVNDTDTGDMPLSYVVLNEPPALAGPPELDPYKKLQNPEGSIITDIAFMNVPSTYIMIIGPNGDEMKVSSKFSKLVNYINERLPASEEYLDKVIKEGTYWKGRFKTWRDKMMNNTLTPTPNNFMDIVELSKLVKEK
jgi:hypothetical protein